MRQQNQNRQVTQSLTWRRLLSLLVVISIAVSVQALVSRLQEARRYTQYEEVIRAVQTGQLHPDAKGDIRLPSRWTWLTKNGHVYQVTRPTSGLVLLFPREVNQIRVDWGDGKVQDHLQVAGDLYCEGSLPKSGWFSFTDMEDVRVHEMEQLPPHWFYAEPFYS